MSSTDQRAFALSVLSVVERKFSFSFSSPFTELKLLFLTVMFRQSARLRGIDVCASSSSFFSSPSTQRRSLVNTYITRGRREKRRRRNNDGGGCALVLFSLLFSSSQRLCAAICTWSSVHGRRCTYARSQKKRNERKEKKEKEKREERRVVRR